LFGEVLGPGGMGVRCEYFGKEVKAVLKSVVSIEKECGDSRKRPLTDES
jgi:hypothetical protein